MFQRNAVSKQYTTICAQSIFVDCYKKPTILVPTHFYLNINMSCNFVLLNTVNLSWMNSLSVVVVHLAVS